MGGYAWVTLATNDSYSLGALVLGHSLKRVKTNHQLAILITPGVTNPMREKLKAVFNVVQEVNILESKDEANLRLLKRPELGITFTKLHCWRLTQFDKCVFLDADTLVLQNCDELFEREELSAAPDVGWPDCFNSGVFVYRPSNETFDKLVQFALEKGSFDGGDQGLLNLYFSDWATKDISKHLPFIYNLCSTACYSYLPAFKQFGINAKIIHFIGSAKPWLQYFNTESKKVQPSQDVQHLEGILQQWWNIFCEAVHPQLTTDMARSTSDVAHTSMPPRSSQNHDTLQPTSTKTLNWDPWEEYDQKQSQSYSENFLYSTPQETDSSLLFPAPSVSNSDHISEPSEIKPVESHNTNAYYASHKHSLSSASQQPTQSESSCHVMSVENPEVPSIPHNCIPQTSLDSISPTQNLQLHSEPLKCAPKLNAPSPPVQSNECEAASTVCKETSLYTAPEEESDGGLAASFAQITLGQPRPEQSALDEHLRRQGWEVGNIDYMGKDSFDNIWNKICETLSTGSSTAATTAETSTSADEKPTEKSVTEASIKVSEGPSSTEPTSVAASETPKVASEIQKAVPSEQCQAVAKPAEQVPTTVAEISKSEDQQQSKPVEQPIECALPPKTDDAPVCPVCPVATKATSEPSPPSSQTQEEKSQVISPEATCPKIAEAPKKSEEVPAGAEVVSQPGSQQQETPQAEVPKQPDTAPTASQTAQQDVPQIAEIPKEAGNVAAGPPAAQVVSQPVQPGSQQQELPQVKEQSSVAAATPTDIQTESKPAQPSSQPQETPQVTEVVKEPVAGVTAPDAQTVSQPPPPSSQPQELPQVKEATKEPVAGVTAPGAQTVSQPPPPSGQPQELPHVTEAAKEPVSGVTAPDGQTVSQPQVKEATKELVTGVTAPGAQTVSQPPPPSSQPQELPQAKEAAKEPVAGVTAPDAQTVSQPPPPSSQPPELTPAAEVPKGPESAATVTPADAQTVSPPGSQQELPQVMDSKKADSVPAPAIQPPSPDKVSEAPLPVPTSEPAATVVPPTPEQLPSSVEPAGDASSPKAASEPVKAETAPSKEAGAATQTSETTATSGAKPSPKTKSEATSATSSSSPTPPPRKTGGGAKKSKSKK